jgi:energy-coupling factor transporter ATP-binding protein EcfA2
VKGLKYGKLVQFEPIETVIKLNSADSKEEAERLVKTYVMSDHMSDSLVEIVIPQLQFDQTIDNKGVFIVGNYGTGKSHLMSVLSVIAEDEQMLEFIKNDKFKESVRSIAGKFEVLRFEIGATLMTLRDIVLSNIERDLKKRGINFKFPKAEDVSDNQQSLLEMMSLFEEVYPDKGYLIVVDELLDYLIKKNESDLIFDLSFLREIGEVSKHCRIRFIAGVQETLFDNPSLKFVSRTMLKVKDRFEQIMIHREDISYVVSQRLLKKTDEQKAWIREHLEKFSFLYKNMADRLEEYVELFPIHPAYLEIFERVHIAEKRQVLKTLTHSIIRIIDEDVPEDELGLISYDTYWRFVKENPSYKTNEDAKEVIDKSAILEGIIEHSFTRPQYKPMALRIIYALSVHRLTTGEIYLPIGLTVENMKDDLCLFDPEMPERDEDFLLSQITTVMKEIFNTVSGQFIEYNKGNEQYYLNVKKDIDFNAKIEQRARVMDYASLNSYYTTLMLNAVEFRREPYNSGSNKIWEYELTWEDRNIERQGYLFFGGPNERPTAQPPRDFYIYFIPPYGDLKYKDSEKEDEVFIFFDGSHEEIKESIRMYAGALSMAERSSKETKGEYEKKAREYQWDAVDWIRKNANQAFTIKYRGENYNLLSLLKGKRPSDKSLKEQLDMAASRCLDTYFSEKYNDYPKFKVTITQANQLEHFKSALNYLAGKKTQQGANILDSFGLLDGEIVRPERSIYARYFLDLLNELDPGKVVNKERIIERRNDIEIDKRFKLSNLWVTLILSSLVYSGDIILAIPGKKYDATMMKELASENGYHLQNYNHFERPKDIPMNVMKKLFEFLNLPPGILVNSRKREEAVSQMIATTKELITRTLEAQKLLNLRDTSIWGKDSIDSHKKEECKRELTGLKDFLESIIRFDTVAKLKNIKFTVEEIEKHERAKEIIKEMDKIRDLKEKLDSNIQYLSKTEIVLDNENFAEWKEKASAAKDELFSLLKDLQSIDDDVIRMFNIKLEELKKEYSKIYMDLHRRYRLSLSEDKDKKRLMGSRKMDNLTKLAAIEGILPLQVLDKVKDKLGSLHTCINLTSEDMNKEILCQFLVLKFFHLFIPSLSHNDPDLFFIFTLSNVIYIPVKPLLHILKGYRSFSSYGPSQIICVDFDLL